MADAKRAARRQAREEVFRLLYETEFHEGETPEEIWTRALETRELDATDPYLRRTYFGVMEHLDEIDELIGRHAKGWKTRRLSRVSRAVLRLGTYEVAFAGKMPAPVAINEAVELTKKFDEPRARSFVNGVLNAIKNDSTTAAQSAAQGAAQDAETPTDAAEAEKVDQTTADN